MKYLIIEGTRRLLQMFFGLQIFTFPVLYSVRCFAYRLLFNMGGECRIGHSVILHREHGCSRGQIEINNRVLLADNVKIDFSGSVIIEDDVWVSENVHIHTHKHSAIAEERKRNHNKCETTSIVIQKGAWLGDSCIILPSCTQIGAGSIVAAGAIVTKDVPQKVIVGGNPAHVIKTL